MDINAIRRFIQTDILDDESAAIGPEDDLLMTQILDSLGVMRLVAHIEEAAGIEIPAEDVTLENFSTLQQIGRYVAVRRDSEGTAPPAS